MLLTALAALCIHAAVVAVKSLAHPDHTLLAMLRVGELPAGHVPAFVREEQFPLEKGGTGTDGQQYLFVAHDPFVARGDMLFAIDAPRYRYGRILLPLLADATCAARSPCIPYAMIGWNLLFAAAIGAWAAWLVRARGLHPGWGLLLACTGALICATDITTTELAAQCFGLLGVVLVERRRLGAAAVAFALAALARETYVLLPFGFALAVLVDARERRWRDAFTLALAALPAVGWALYLRVRHVPEGAGGGARLNFAPPFWGLLSHVVAFARAPHFSGGTAITLLVAVPLLIAIGRHFAALRRDRGGLAIAGACFAIVGVFASAQVWVSPGGFARGLDFLYPSLLLCALVRRDRFAWVLAGSTVLHAVNLVADHLA